MKKLLLAMLLVGGLAACTGSGKKVEALQTEVLALHDTTMAKMDAIYVMIDDLKAVKTRMEADSMNPDPMGIVQVLDAITQLRKADEGMMDWMANFEPVKEDAPADSSHAYLLKQKASIVEVDMDIERSLKNGKAILDAAK